MDHLFTIGDRYSSFGMQGIIRSGVYFRGPFLNVLYVPAVKEVSSSLVGRLLRQTGVSERGLNWKHVRFMKSGIRGHLHSAGGWKAVVENPQDATSTVCFFALQIVA